MSPRFLWYNLTDHCLVIVMLMGERTDCLIVTKNRYVLTLLNRMFV